MLILEFIGNTIRLQLNKL